MTLENSLSVPYKVKHVLNICPSNSAYRCLPWEVWKHIYIEMRKRMFVAALFRITLNWKQLMSFNWWVDKQIVEYYSEIKKDKLLMQLKHYNSKRMQTPDSTYLVILFIQNSRTGAAIVKKLDWWYLAQSRRDWLG